jgi:hypothetical protein
MSEDATSPAATPSAASGNDSSSTQPPADRATDTQTGTSTSSGNERNTNNNSRAGFFATSRSTADSTDRHFCGDTPAIGVILGLRTERIDKKTAFDNFREKLANYVLTNLKDAQDVIQLVEEQIDPRESFKKNNKPKPLTDEQKKDDIDVMIQTQYLKIYASREFAIKDNMNKIYGLFWGQCTHSLQCVIKNGSDFKDKHRAKDVLWLMSKLKEVTSGIDSKSNKRANLHEAILIFFYDETRPIRRR